MLDVQLGIRGDRLCATKLSYCIICISSSYVEYARLIQGFCFHIDTCRNNVVMSFTVEDALVFPVFFKYLAAVLIANHRGEQN